MRDGPQDVGMGWLDHGGGVERPTPSSAARLYGVVRAANKRWTSFLHPTGITADFGDENLILPETFNSSASV